MRPATGWLDRAPEILPPAAPVDPQGLSLGAALVLALLGLVVAFQLYPAFMLLLSLVKGLLRHPAHRRRARQKARR